MDASKAYNQWFFVARDPETPTALPYGTVMLHGACANDPDRFAVAERILRIAFMAGFEAGTASVDCEECGDTEKEHAETRVALDRAIATLIRISENAEACLNTMTCAGESQ